MQIDVELHRSYSPARVDAVPMLRYLPARYKALPYYMQGFVDDAAAIGEWIRAHHTIRYVDIPGEAPSPFARSDAAATADLGRSAPPDVEGCQPGGAAGRGGCGDTAAHDRGALGAAVA